MSGLLGYFILTIFGAFFLATFVTANQVPKVFVDIKIINMLDPLQHGFHVVLNKDFVHHYLNPVRMPTIYLSVLPLKQSGNGSEATNKLLYREDIVDNVILAEGLQERAWYYICVEFENVVRRHSQGNTSTECHLSRTLDKFGRAAESTISDLRISQIHSDSMEFQISVEAQFPLQVSAFLQHGSSPMQMYILSSETSLRILFPLLSPGFNYGRLCLLEQPLEGQYTMMGRTAHSQILKCHFDDLLTKPSGFSSQGGRLKARDTDMYGNVNPLMYTASSSDSVRIPSSLTFIFLLVIIHFTRSRTEL